LVFAYFAYFVVNILPLLASVKLLFLSSQRREHVMPMKTQNTDNSPTKPTPQPLSHPLPDPNRSARRRFGKIARLPRELRELLNIMLRDGAAYSRIAEKLAEHGHRITIDNLSRWHSGGYKEWVEDQAWLEEMRVRLDFANDIVHQKNGAAIDAASLRIAVTQMYTFLTRFDPAALTAQVANNAGAYPRILNALCKLTEAGIKCEHHRRDDEYRASKLSRTTATPIPTPT
jgi:hypothetical protein